MKNALLALGVLLAAVQAWAQAPGVPVPRQGRQENEIEENLLDAGKRVFDAGVAIKLKAVKNQLKRTSCELNLPPVKTSKLTVREVFTQAQDSHWRIGWSYLCTKCDKWHVNLAGGYALTGDGVVATCFHVVQPDSTVRDGCLIAADEDGKVLAVTEVLAANRYSDTCLVRVAGTDFKPLSLNTNVFPGDPAFCYSDPLDHHGYFSTGIVNRFYQFPGRYSVNSTPESAFAPTRLNVSTDWAPGSSGSAVLDECGNVIGHVSTIAAVGEEEVSAKTKTVVRGPTMIVFHEAVAARDVLLLIKPGKPIAPPPRGAE